MADGRLNICKECHKARVRANREASVERYRAYDASRNQLQHRVAARAEYSATPAGKAAHRAAKERWKLAHLLEKAAHRAVAYAVSTGALKRAPCESCGAGRAHAHHDDYSKPLEVRWLCAKCHKLWHKENP